MPLPRQLMIPRGCCPVPCSLSCPHRPLFHLNSGVSGGMDSFFEYLLKAGIALDKPEYIKMFATGYAAINKHVKKDVW